MRNELRKLIHNHILCDKVLVVFLGEIVKIKALTEHLTQEERNKFFELLLNENNDENEPV
jgi:hypothetical protein